MLHRKNKIITNNIVHNFFIFGDIGKFQYFRSKKFQKSFSFNCFFFLSMRNVLFSGFLLFCSRKLQICCCSSRVPNTPCTAPSSRCVLPLETPRRRRRKGLPKKLPGNTQPREGPFGTRVTIRRNPLGGLVSQGLR